VLWTVLATNEDFFKQTGMKRKNFFNIFPTEVFSDELKLFFKLFCDFSIKQIFLKK
jgi:hypothetical protein